MKAAILLVLPTMACFDQGVPLAELGPVSAQVMVNVGAPAMPFSGEEEMRNVQLYLEGTAAGCPRLDEVDVDLDGVAPNYVELGGMESGTNHGKEESYCVEPAFYFDYLPAPRPTSSIAIADASASLSIEVDQLLVNPAIRVDAPLHPGMTTTAIVTDGRPLASAKVWWRGDYDDPQRVDWFAEGDVSTPGQIQFVVPTTAVGAGTLGIEVSITDHVVDCVGFTSCAVALRGGASFQRSTN